MFPPFDPMRTERKRRRFRAIPVRTLVPNVITLLALCAGLTAIRFSVEARLEWAIAAIVFAAALDGIDGRVARLIKGQSRFGAELDSLADFVNFGVAPGVVLYFWGLLEFGNVGWIAAMVFAICAGLRLARFNVAIDDPNRPAWAGNFFTGMPAPAGAITVLLPIYLHFLGVPFRIVAPLALGYTLIIAVFMVSRLPVFSGKKIGTRVAPEMVLPIFVVVVLFVAIFISYPWPVLTIGTLCYLALLPLGWLSHRRYEHAGATAALPARPAAEAAPASSGSPGSPGSSGSSGPSEPSGESEAPGSPLHSPGEPADQRPSRLN